MTAQTASVAMKENPLTTGLQTSETLREIASLYWGDRGSFAYRGFDWINANLFDGRLPVPLIQLSLTPHGHCLGLTHTDPKKPVITLHPSLWDSPDAWGGIPSGALYAFDVLTHECLHVALSTETDRATWHSSHDNDAWPAEVIRISPLIGLGSVVASRTKRARVGGRMRRIPADTSAISMYALSRWPGSLRSSEYYQTARLPF